VGTTPVDRPPAAAPRSPHVGRRSGGGAHVAQYGIAPWPAARTVVADVDEDAGGRQPAVRARDAAELPQRDRNVTIGFGPRLGGIASTRAIVSACSGCLSAA